MQQHVHQRLIKVIYTSRGSLVEHDTHDIIRGTTTRSDGGTADSGIMAQPRVPTAASQARHEKYKDVRAQPFVSPQVAKLHFILRHAFV